MSYLYASALSLLLILFSQSYANVETHHLPEEWGNLLAYNVSVPNNYSSRTDWPLLLYFHGNGGQGTNGQNKPPASSLWKEKVVMLAPQAGLNNTWWKKDQRIAAKAILDHELTVLNVDPNKIIIVGQSMGGYGSFLFANDYPEVPCAVAPISGGWGNFNSGRPPTSGYPDDMSPLDHIPYWIFHGKNDTTVRIGCSQQAYDMMTADGIHTKFTTYFNQAHHPRNHIYNSQMFYDWAFAQEKNTPHNFQLSIEIDGVTSVDGYFESGSVVSITCRQADRVNGEFFYEWTATSAVHYEDGGGPKITVTYPSQNLGTFDNPKSQTTQFIMGSSDVRLKANYRLLPNVDVSLSGTDSEPIVKLNYQNSEDLKMQRSYDLVTWTDMAIQDLPYTEEVDQKKFFRLQILD
ncbi:MAG: hypothetical protein VXZ08_02405 [Verrucomicrobiota bacterium]|nr:hypothetical protein [Verrucomicrobiota bacterium]